MCLYIFQVLHFFIDISGPKYNNTYIITYSTIVIQIDAQPGNPLLFVSLEYGFTVYLFNRLNTFESIGH